MPVHVPPPPDVRDSALDELTALAARVCGTPIAMVSFVDRDHDWIKSYFGPFESEIPTSCAFCSHAIFSPDPLEVPDATADPRFAANPFVVGPPHIRFYAGITLRSSDGKALGTLCVLDTRARTLTPDERQFLEVISRQVMAQVQLRQQANALVQSEARLRLVTDNARVGLVIVGPDRRYRYANRAYAEVLGLPSADIVGSRLADVLGPLYDEQVSPRLDRAFAGETVSYELLFHAARPEGCFTVRYEPIETENGERVVIVVISDITDLRRSQAALQEREVQLRLFADHSPAAIAMFDRDMRYLVVSQRWTRDYGMPADSFIGRSHYDVFPEIPERWKDIHRRCLAGAIESCDEDPFVRADGHIEWNRWETRPWHQADGSIGGIVIFTENITERKRADQALHDAEERMRFALESADIGIWDADYTTGVVSWSPILERHFGLATGTFGGSVDAFLAQVHPDDLEAVQQILKRAMASGNDFSMQHRVIRPDGAVRWFSGAGRVQLSDDGRPLRAVGISFDITERHTLELQYQQAQKMEAVGRLAGGVAHDFNNLLTAILGYCELLLTDFSDHDPRRGDVEEIQRAGKSAAALTRQLLAFSRKQIVEPTLLDLNVVVSDLRGMLARLIGEDVRIALDLSTTPLQTLADRGQLEQVLVNLAVNARDAMPHGGRLTLQTSPEEVRDHDPAAPSGLAPGNYNVMTISDTGTGMSADVQSHLFEPFFTTKEMGKGTGLGLATVHGIVTQNGGAISVSSQLEHGTSFKVYLPAANGRAQMVGAPPTTTRPAANHLKILIVEDEPGVRTLTRRLLEREGYQVVTAADPQEALDAFRAHRDISLLLTDVVMPGSSGADLTGQLADAHPSLKIIYMSGYTEEAILQSGVVRTGVNFLHKPFTADALMQKIRVVLEG